MTHLSTPWSDAMGLRAPIVGAPMGGVAGGRLAAAISAAGGLGMIGMGSAGGARALEEELRHAHGARVRFGIGLIDWAVHRDPALLETALAARPALVSVSFGEDWSWAERAAAAGIVTATQVYDRDQARRAADAGIEVLVARGAEGGGHGQTTLGTLALLETVLDAVSVPVLAAGGIATGRGLAAVLAAGASGAWLGTAFAACPESLAPDGVRRALLRAAGTDTVATRVFDIALGHPWPPGVPERVLRSRFTDRWTGREDELAAAVGARAGPAAGASAEVRGEVPVNAGQGVGLLTEILPAADVVDRLCAGAVELLRSHGRP